MVIHITGADSYRSAQRVSQLRQAWRDKHDPRGLNTVSLDGSTLTVEELRNALTTVGIFSAKRMVVIDHYASSDSAVAWPDLKKLLEPMVKSNDLVVVLRDESVVPHRAKKSQAKKPKSLAGGKTVIVTGEKTEHFPALDDGEMLSWVTVEAKARGGQIENNAAKKLVALCNRDSWRVATELNKLLAYAGSRIITETDVGTMVMTEYASDIFALTDAIGNRQSARALELLHRELAAGTNPQALLAILASHLRRLIQVSSANQRGLPTAAIIEDTGLHPFVVQKALAQIKFFSIDQLRHWHHQLVSIDHDLKTSPLDAETLLDLLVLQV